MINKSPPENNVLIGLGDYEANRPQEADLRCLVVRPSGSAFPSGELILEVRLFVQNRLSSASTCTLGTPLQGRDPALCGFRSLESLVNSLVATAI